MTEITVTTNKVQHLVDGSLHIWGWEVPLYLFLGGLTAGILVIVSWMILKYRRRDHNQPETGDSTPITTSTSSTKNHDFVLSINRLIIAAPLALSIGMLALFLDLDHKLYVWRFYTTFKITSPMSWGSWVLLLVYPLSILLFLATFRDGFPRLYGRLDHFLSAKKNPKKHHHRLHRIFDFAERHQVLWARLTIPVGIILGIYTGILLSAFSARPFWNSALLGPLFLVSGISAAAALVVLLSRRHKEQHFFTRLDLVLIGIEIAILLLFIIGMLSSSQVNKEAMALILGGPLTAFFWVLVVGIGLLLPAFLEAAELRGKKVPAAIAAVLVLVGSLLLRFLVVEAGQLSTWVTY